MSWQIVVVFHEKNLYLKKGRFRFWFSCCRGAWPVAEVYKLGSRRSRPTHHQVSSENGFFVQFFYKNDHLPRQARDKHRENSKKAWHFLAGTPSCRSRMGKRTLPWLSLWCDKTKTVSLVL
jgi:hypothetical protein